MNLGTDRTMLATPVHLAFLQPPDSALTALPWGVVADPLTGRIFVADANGARVVLFDSSGRFVRTIGRSGDGPGEFRNPVALALSGDTIAVWDARRGIISRWSSAGELVNESRAPFSYWGPGFAIQGSSVVGVTQSTDENVQQQLLVTSTGRDEPDEIFVVTRELVPLNLPGISTLAPRIFAPDLIWTTVGDTIWVRNGPEYRIDAYHDARLVGSIRRDIDPLTVTGALAAARVRFGPYTSFMRRTGVTVDQMVAALGHEEMASPIEWIASDVSGHLWVSRGSGYPVPDQIDVFDADGHYVGTFDAPGFPVAFPTDSSFVALEITDMGEPVLSLYQLRSGRDDGGRSGEAVSLVENSVFTPVEDTQLQSHPQRWMPRPHDDELEPGDEFRDCSRCPVMVVIPPGRFTMGSPDGEAFDELREQWHHLFLDEKPQVEVHVDYPLAVGKYEVTFAEWNQCVEAGGCSYEPDDEGFGRGDRPVINVNRIHAQEYLAWLSRQTGKEYRLPSEAEWEYAARAGTSTARYWGDAIASGHAVCDGCGSPWDGRSTAPVGSFPANSFGLHDMLGNVTEWASDCYYRSNDAGPKNGAPRLEISPYWNDGTCTVHVRRGGSWRSPAWRARAAGRTPFNTKGPWRLDAGPAAGLRVVRELLP